MIRILAMCSIGPAVLVVACAAPPPAGHAPAAADSVGSKEPPAPARIKPHEPSQESATTQVAPFESAETYVTAMERVSAHFAAHSTDCTALAKALQADGESRTHLVTASTGPAHQHANSVPELQARLANATYAIADGSMRCSESPEFAAVRDRAQRVERAAP